MSYTKCIWEKDEAPWVVLQQESVTHPSLQLHELVKQKIIYITRFSLQMTANMVKYSKSCIAQFSE